YQVRVLIAGAKLIVEEAKKQRKTSTDTGGLINKASCSKPERINGKRTSNVHWQGSKNRYQIGDIIEKRNVKKQTGKSIKTKAMGGVNREIRQWQNKIFVTIKRTLKRL
ncbi:hypothetical protein, partial [Staphylococcus aureus]|uniref:hypothetical protein n=1 Tax=Staphylococcus aureus TaxID=1280 RepID=UPI00065BCA0F